MTCASLSALLIADEAAPQGKGGSAKECEKGLAWVSENFSLASSSGSYYNLHAVARLGSISGEQSFGKHDWFHEGAEWLLKHRHTDGSFISKAGVDASPVVSTSFALLFLNATPAKDAAKPTNKGESNLPASIKQLVGQADRIVVATASSAPTRSTEGEAVSLAVIETLKGPPQKSLRVIQGTNDASILNQESSDRRRWIVFLRSQDEGPSPKSAPLRAQSWFVDADKELLAKIKATLPLPAEWDNGDWPIRLGVRLRSAKVKRGADVAIEVALKNASENANDAPLPVLAHRMNIYDYWPHTTFEVVAPNGKTYILEKPAGKMSESDVPNTILLAPGETYIQVMRLNVWPAMTAEERTTTGEPLPNLFTKAGEYTIRCRYQHTQVKGPAPTFVSNAVKVTVE
jgi:hypothetical protein